MLNSILFTHNDLDGVGCKIIYALAHLHESIKQEDGYHVSGIKEYDGFAIHNCAISYLDTDFMNICRDENLTIDENTEIIFADICPKDETLEYIANHFNNVKIFDHHETNERAKKYFPDAVVIEKNGMGIPECGTSLLYQYYQRLAIEEPTNLEGEYFYKSGNQNLIDLFVDTVRSYDTYEWKETNNKLAQYLNTLYYMIGIDSFSDIYINRLIDKDHNELITPIEMMFITSKLAMEQKLIDSFSLKDVIPVIVNGRNIAFCYNTKGLAISELAYQFLNKHKEFDGMASFTFARNGKYDFRSIKDDVDMAVEIAAKIGGGGHPKSAGAPLSDLDRQRIIDILIEGLYGTL